MNEPAPLALEPELRSVAQLKMLQSLSRRLNQLNDVRQIAEAITLELRTLVDYHNCRVHLIDDDGHTLTPIAFRGELSEYKVETFDALVMQVGEGITGRVAVTGEPIYTPDAARCDFARQIPGTPEVDESILVAPLSNAEVVIGTVALSKLGIDQFDEDDLRVLELVGSHAGVAIANARLLERERDAAMTSRALLKLSQALTRVTESDQVVTQAIASIPALIRCSDVHAWMRDPKDGSFGLVARGGDPATATLLGETRPMQVSADLAAGYLLSVEEPFVLSHEIVTNLPDEYRRTVQDREILVTPIRWEPDGLGTLAIFAADVDARFSARDLEFARGIADITSLAFGNATRFQELRESAERLRALDEMKNTFLNAVSHELRTPLAVVLGSALTLERIGLDLSEDDQQALLHAVAANAKKLERMLTDLLDLDRLTRGVLKPHLVEMDLGRLVAGVVEGADFLGGRPVHLEARSVVASVDGPKVERIVENLLANAAKYTPEESPIWVRVEAASPGVLLVVEDCGPGIPSELRERIFEPFHQGPNAQANRPGVGIGLSLVSSFAEIHGGRAWIEDRPGGGSSFRVLLGNGSATS